MNCHELKYRFDKERSYIILSNRHSAILYSVKKAIWQTVLGEMGILTNRYSSKESSVKEVRPKGFGQKGSIN